MKSVALFAMIALVPAWGQIQLKQAPPASVAAKPAATLPTGSAPQATLSGLEKSLDYRLSSTGGAEPFVVLGNTRGLYISGFGAVFTTEVDLIATPGFAFATSFPPEQKALIHKRKLANAPLLQKIIRDMVMDVVKSSSLKLADSDQIVVAVRPSYHPWEDVTNLPALIVARSDRRGADIKVEVQ